jgi:hypothetical protein
MAPWLGRIKRYSRMRGRKIKQKEGAAIGRYIRNIADIIQRGNDIRIADIMPNRSYIRSTVDITKLSEIAYKKCYYIRLEWNAKMNRGGIR